MNNNPEMKWAAARNAKAIGVVNAPRSARWGAEHDIGAVDIESAEPGGAHEPRQVVLQFEGLVVTHARGARQPAGRMLAAGAKAIMPASPC